MFLSLVLALVVAAAPESSPVVLAHRFDLTGCRSTQGWGASAYSVNPDKQAMAVVRGLRSATSATAALASEPLHEEIAYLDLREGRTIASRRLPSSIDFHLALSRDARTVVILRTFGDCGRCPYGISVWKPYSDPEELKDYNLAAGSSNGGNNGQREFGSFAGSPPVVSPDGKLVALFGRQLSEQDKPSDELEDNALGVLDLETGKVTVMPLPINFPGGQWKHWSLGWSSDGSSLYAVLHGRYSEERHGEYVPGQPAPLAHRPDLTLYRFSLATKAVTRVGLVPPTTIGFGPDDNLIVADTVREGWGPHKAFALLPISQVEEGQVASGAAGLAFVAGLKMQTVVGQDDPAFASFRQVFVGRTHTYAEVDKKGTNGCTALVERVTANAAIK